jgi:hypothetical protein
MRCSSIVLKKTMSPIDAIEVGAHSTDNNENRARSYREQVLEEHDMIQATRYRGL